MKKSFLKVFTIVLMCLVLSGLSAGCGDDKTAQSPATTPASGTPSQQGQTQSSARQDSYQFKIYNKSGYEIYAVYMGPADGAAGEDVDILETSTLPNGESATVKGNANARTTEWTLYIEDVDGDTSSSYSFFNPFELNHVDVFWDANGYYVCDFSY
ncbi:MAG: hypothetical protein VB084_02935 [Syntrophomonadaceae bacterium]|nr:hypothetical protein [Syntrophomonadaceae bacterium]